MSQTATLILTHGQIHTLDRANPTAEAVAIADGKIVATGSHDRIMSFAAEGTQIVDLKGHTVIGPQRFSPAPDPRWVELQP